MPSSTQQEAVRGVFFSFFFLERCTNSVNLPSMATVIAKVLFSLAIASGLSHVGAAADSLLSSSSSCAVAFARIVPLSAHSGMRAAGH